MQEKGIKTLKQLCVESGANYGSFRNARNRMNVGINLTSAWLIAEYLQCDIKDIVKPEWEA